MFPGHMWGEWWVWLIGVLLMFLFWAGVIALIIYAIRAIAHSNKGGSEPPSSSYQRGSYLDILKERYARGEITREEYKETRRELEE
jgi:putative membrane protein